jgi:hypothetical protein
MPNRIRRIPLNDSPVRPNSLGQIGLRALMDLGRRCRCTGPGNANGLCPKYGSDSPPVSKSAVLSA